MSNEAVETNGRQQGDPGELRAAKAKAKELRGKLDRTQHRLRERTLKLERAEATLEARELEAKRLERSAADLEQSTAAELERQSRLTSETLAESREAQRATEQDLARVRERLEAVEARLRTADPPSFYLVGHAKSGTTWLMRLLDAHPEIMCKGEGRIFGRNYLRPDVKAMDAPTFQPASLYRSLLEAEYLNLWIERSVWTRGGDGDAQLRDLTRAAIRSFLGARLATTDKLIVGDKTPFMSDSDITEIAAIDPEAKVIHIIRDGRDVAVSGMHHLWRRTLDLGGGRDLRPEEERTRDLYRADPNAVLDSGEGIFTEQRICEMAEGWREMVSGARAQAADLLGDRYVEVHYEDLLQRAAPELRRVVLFLGADGRAELARRCVHAASFKRWTKGRSRGQEDSDSLLRKGIAGDWKRVFTPDDRRIFAEHAGDLLIELGYERDDSWA